MGGCRLVDGAHVGRLRVLQTATLVLRTQGTATCQDTSQRRAGSKLSHPPFNGRSQADFFHKTSLSIALKVLQVVVLWGRFSDAQIPGRLAACGVASQNGGTEGGRPGEGPGTEPPGAAGRPACNPICLILLPSIWVTSHICCCVRRRPNTMHLLWQPPPGQISACRCLVRYCFQYKRQAVPAVGCVHWWRAWGWNCAICWW